jgi:histidine triad (HIT) family protein
MRAIALGLLLGLFSTAAHAEASGLKCSRGAPYDVQNAFAKIASGERQAAIVYADRLVIAFVPIDWDNPGHTLIIPRRHVRSLDDMSDAEMLAVFHLIRRIAKAQERAFGATGYSIEQNNGRHQTVCHAHFHVIPNTPEQKVDKATPEQMQAIAAKLRAALPRR